jgi:rRNA pseudouridine-1189 N-methylase Emg1 (Nep1/Mra1 family)
MTSQEKYITETIKERVNLLLSDSRIMAEYQKKGSQKEAEQWIFDQALFTLMYSPEEREKLVNEKGI